MKTILTVLLFAALTTFAAGCGASPREQGKKEKLEVAAAFYPLAFAAELIGDGRVEVSNLTPPGAEPHDLEVSPGDVRRIRSADYVFLLGDDFQPQLEDAAGQSRRVVSLLDTPFLERLPNGDPHVWLDPLRYAVIVRRIGEVLDAPRRAASLAWRLLELDVEFRQGLSRCERREIVTSHEAFAYLAQRYGLRQIAITGISPEAEPTPQDLQRVVRQVRETAATTIFFETLVSPRIAETVARETGARTAVLNPIEGLTSAEARRGADYFSLMRANLRSLRRALGCR
jgi:zinc transport system substrate-binding protein